MSQETTTYYTEWSNSVECMGCNRRLYVAPYPLAALPAVAAKVGWQYRGTGETACEECAIGLGIEGQMQAGFFAAALVAEDKAPKQTEQEAAQAYDAETLSRLWDLGGRLRRAGQLDPVAVELVEHAWAALDWVLNHPGQEVHGLPTGQLSSLRDRSEAL